MEHLGRTQCLQTQTSSRAPLLRWQSLLGKHSTFHYNTQSILIFLADMLLRDRPRTMARWSEAMPLAPDASREEDEACAGHPLILLTVCCATTADWQEVWGRSPNAATAESTDLVANALAQMAIVPEKALMEWQGEQKGPLYAMCGTRCFAGPWPDDLRPRPFRRMHPERRAKHVPVILWFSWRFAVQPQLIDRRCGAEAQMQQRLRALTLLLMPSPKWR